MFVVGALLVWNTWAAVHVENPRTYVFISFAVQTLFFCNALFHGLTTILFNDYSPGVLSGLLLFVPVTLLLFRRKIRSHFLSESDFIAAVVTGFVGHGLILLNLFVDKGPSV